MKTYNITLTEQERALVLHCIGRVEAITSIQYEEQTEKPQRQKLKRDSAALVALWHKITNTETAKKNGHAEH